MGTKMTSNNLQTNFFKNPYGGEAKHRKSHFRAWSGDSNIFNPVLGLGLSLQRQEKSCLEPIITKNRHFGGSLGV